MFKTYSAAGVPTTRKPSWRAGSPTRVFLNNMIDDGGPVEFSACLIYIYKRVIRSRGGIKGTRVTRSSNGARWETNAGRRLQLANPWPVSNSGWVSRHTRVAAGAQGVTVYF